MLEIDVMCYCLQVAGVVGRADLCAAVLCFGAFICFVKSCSAGSKTRGETPLQP